MKCRYCKSTNLERRGIHKGRKTYRCLECGRWSSQRIAEESIRVKGEEKFVTKIVTHEVRNEKDLIRVCEIDTDEWYVHEWRCEAGTWDAYRANKKKDLEFDEGKITGTVKDKGKITKAVLQTFRVTATLRRKTEEIKVREIVRGMIDDAKKFSPSYPQLNFKVQSSGYRYEVFMPDIQFGRLTWAEESGENYDIKIAQRVVDLALNNLLEHAFKYPIEKIILPIGNDFYNADTPEETTAHGTRQQEDTRWQKTFRAGRKLFVRMIDTCVQIAPVLVPVVPGNHDEQRMFYVGDVLQAWYRQQPNVEIDNRVRFRKYYQWGNNMLGLTHGYWEKLTDLPGLMADEERKMWAASDNREFHVGDKHHAKVIRNDKKIPIAPEAVLDIRGTTIRQVRSLAGIDAWTFNKGFTGSIHAAEAYLWDNQAGIVANFTAKVDKADYS